MPTADLQGFQALLHSGWLVACQPADVDFGSMEIDQYFKECVHAGIQERAVVFGF